MKKFEIKGNLSWKKYIFSDILAALDFRELIKRDSFYSLIYTGKLFDFYI